MHVSRLLDHDAPHGDAAQPRSRDQHATSDDPDPHLCDPLPVVPEQPDAEDSMTGDQAEGCCATLCVDDAPAFSERHDRA